MSMGIGAVARLVLQDEATVIYEYGSYNYNDVRFMNKARVCDGMITINRECFIEPEIHEKLKRMKNGRKKLIRKRILVPVNYHKYIEEGLIVVDNCSNCWKTMEDEKCTDVIVSKILYTLFNKYQEQGTVPEIISLYS